MNTQTPGQIMFTTYCATIGGSHPAWEQLNAADYAAWEAAATAVINAFTPQTITAVSKLSTPTTNPIMPSAPSDLTAPSNAEPEVPPPQSTEEIV